MKTRNEEKELLKRLSAGLSEEEIHRVLAGAVKCLDRSGLDRLAKNLGTETGAALRQVLETGPGKEPLKSSSEKIREEWDRAWEEWDQRISEGCDEEGDYVIQEHHWEEPYFDPMSLTHDLEPIAARMKKILPRVFEEDLDTDFSFSQAVRDGMEEIESSLPDWMDPFGNECFGLGPQATGCLLEWEWRSALRLKMTAFQFVNKLCELEVSTKGLGLDENTVARFIRGLSSQAKKDIFQGIQLNREQEPWKQALDSPRSGWFEIFKELCRLQDRPAYLQNCRSRISQDWTLALPVLKDLEHRKDHAEILKVSGEALRSLLYLREEEKWDLRENLLVPRAGSGRGVEPDARLFELFNIWHDAANALHQEEVAVAIRLQSDLLKDWRNLDKAIAAFRRVPEPLLASLRKCLFTQWRDLVAEHSVERSLFEPWTKTHERPHWVHFLADAAWETEAGKNFFYAELKRWLDEIERNAEILRSSQNALARLSLDIEGASWLAHISPQLVRILSYSSSDDPALRASRRRWLERFGASCLVSELLSFWKRNIRRLIPDPAQARTSDYSRSAEWVQAFWEFDSTACRELLRQWSVAHHRRRNLWRALREKGLSVPGVGQ